MRLKALLVLALSVVAITLYWFPQPLVVGDYVLGGYPWYAPESSRGAMIAIGVIFTAVFLGLTALMFYISREVEKLPGNPEPAREELAW
ncbi:MAG: hypothetical protein LM563_00780 [Thermofilum sp.]|jgi:uncharacterized membrane protein YciS (DUF1049 family)|nr:hypothetical protein [Thermofilum sp.]MCC6058771.1 hypothetical protein [Thermofilum sp.]